MNRTIPSIFLGRRPASAIAFFTASTARFSSVRPESLEYLVSPIPIYGALVLQTFHASPHYVYILHTVLAIPPVL